MNVTRLGAEGTKLVAQSGRYLGDGRRATGDPTTDDGQVAGKPLRSNFSVYPSVLIRVKLALTGHHDDDGREAMNDLDRRSLCR